MAKSRLKAERAWCPHAFMEMGTSEAESRVRLVSLGQVERRRSHLLYLLPCHFNFWGGRYYTRLLIEDRNQ